MQLRTNMFMLICFLSNILGKQYHKSFENISYSMLVYIFKISFSYLSTLVYFFTLHLHFLIYWNIYTERKDIHFFKLSIPSLSIKFSKMQKVSMTWAGMALGGNLIDFFCIIIPPVVKIQTWKWENLPAPIQLSLRSLHQGRFGPHKKRREKFPNYNVH